ncbi:MAG TPA: permease-like cell division protein FtsX [Myxococcota bacterium]|nr:permease-like cell division protein FtsX [Myxococcota bacterium]
MNRLLARIATLVRSALRGFAASPLTSGVAVVTIAVTLVLVGAFALLVANMEAVLGRFGDALRVTAFLEDGLDEDAQRALVSSAAALEGVESVSLVSREQALERFRRGVGRGAALLEGLSENPLPASLEISLAPQLRSAEGLARVADAVAKLPGVSDVASGRDWVEGYLRGVALVRGVGTGLGVILALASLLIIANTIRLAVLSRRDELEILSLVGASRSYVAAPFLMEGWLQGALGGALALGALYAIFRLVLPGLEFGLELVLGGVAPRFFELREALALVLAGSALGLFGAGVAVASESRA